MSSPFVSPYFEGSQTGASPTPRRLGVVKGEGIGPSVIEAALVVLDAVENKFAVGFELDVLEEMNSRDEYGLVLDAQTRGFYERCFAAATPILHGPAGGRFVYQLRDEFALGVKFTPIQPIPALTDASILRPERAAGTDILIVRDNAAGLYQGGFGWRDNGETAFHEASYHRAQVAEVFDAAVRAAQQRRGRLAVVLKPGGVPTISELWRETAQERASDRVTLEFIEIDNACFQLIANPKQFDVLVSPNMFGDVLGDTAAAVLGSRGLAYSANFGSDARAVYQTAHGAAHDLVGKNSANPVAQILALAWLLRQSLGMAEAAAAIEQAVSKVLVSGIRTADIAAETSTVVTTDELARLIAAGVQRS